MESRSEQPDHPDPSAPARWLAAWALLTVVLLPWCWSDHFNGDEFHFLTQIARITRGEVPMRDFFEFVMPGSLFLTAGLFKLVGPSLLAARVFQTGLVAALAVGYAVLGRSLGLGRGMALLPPALLLGVFYTWQPGFSHHWFGQVGVGVVLLALWRTLGSRHEAAWALVGAAVGLTYVLQQMTGAAVLLGVGLGALWAAWRLEWSPARTVRCAGFFLAGAAVPLALLAGYFLVHGALASAFWMTHIWSLTNYRSAGNHNDVAYLTDLAGMLSPRRLWFNLGYWYAGLGVYLFTAVLPLAGMLAGGAWLLGLGRAPTEARSTTFLGMAVVIGSCLFLAATRGRADLAHVLYVAPIWGLVLASAIARWQREPGVGSLRWMPAALAFGVVGCHLMMELTELRRTPESVLNVETPDRRIASREAFQVLRERLAPSDTILAINGAAEATIFYFYLAPNPTRYTSWTFPGDGYTTPAQFQEIVAAVAERQPRLILYPHFTPDLPDRRVGRYFPSYRRVAAVPFPEDVPWVRRRTVFVYERVKGS